MRITIPSFIFILTLSTNLFSQDMLNSTNFSFNKSSIYNKSNNCDLGFAEETYSFFSREEKTKYSGSGFGARFGIGTDITLGIGFGVGAFYIFYPTPYSSPVWDLGADIYYASVSEEETEPSIKYEDNTKVFVFALRSNALFNYHPNRTGFYFVAGAGIVFANIDWEEKITYSAPYAPTTEHWSNDAFVVGNVLNLGAGLTFGGGLEARLETPLLIFYSTPGYGGRSASSVAPTFTLSLLYRFP